MASHQVFKSGKVALITGAASKIGLEVAKLCSGYKMKLVLVDQDTAGLYETRREIGQATRIRCLPMDVSKADHWEYIKLEVEEFCGSLDLLFLNENLSLPNRWEDKAQRHKMMDQNALGVMEGVSWFLPGLLRKTTPTAILITGSTEGVSESLRDAAYAASKGAVEAFAETLHKKLQSKSTSVHILVSSQVFESNEVMNSSSFCEKLGAKFLRQTMLSAELRIGCPCYIATVNESWKRKSRIEGGGPEIHSGDEEPISKRLKIESRD
ncbi:MAG: hypothetical protein Q9183_004883 [Haloplaca sp. 2 TL-2023]